VRIIIGEGKPRKVLLDGTYPCWKIGNFIHHVGDHVGALDMNKTYQISIEMIEDESDE